MSRVARDEPSGSASGEEGGLGFFVGVEEEEQAFSVLVKKKVSGFFWKSEEDGERGELGGGRRKRESELFVFIRPTALNTCLFPRIALFFCVAALEPGMDLADWPCMEDACACRPLHAPGLLLGLFNRVVME